MTRRWLCTSIGLAKVDPEECTLLLRNPDDWSMNLTILASWPPPDGVEVGAYVTVHVIPTGARE